MPLLPHQAAGAAASRSRPRRGVREGGRGAPLSRSAPWGQRVVFAALIWTLSRRAPIPRRRGKNRIGGCRFRGSPRKDERELHFDRVEEPRPRERGLRVAVRKLADASRPQSIAADKLTNRLVPIRSRLTSLQTRLARSRSRLTSSQSCLVRFRSGLRSSQSRLVRSRSRPTSSQPRLVRFQSGLRSSQPRLVRFQSGLRSSQPRLVRFQSGLRSSQSRLVRIRRGPQGSRPSLSRSRLRLATLRSPAFPCQSPWAGLRSYPMRSRSSR
jgi:hypothetical protein